MNFQQRFNQTLLQLARHYLIQELTQHQTPHNPQQLYACHQLNKKPNTFSNTNVASYLNPFFITKNDSLNEQDQQNHLKKCVLTSKQPQDLNLLLHNVLEMPKLRYKQSQVNLDIQNNQNSYVQSQTQVSPTILNFETPTKKRSQPSTLKKPQQTYSQQFKVQSTTEQTSRQNFRFDLPSNKHILQMNESALEQQLDIQSNISARSRFKQPYLNSQKQWIYSTTNRLGDKYSKAAVEKESFKKKNQQTPWFNNQQESQSSIKAKNQKSSVQSYFQSAKNQILENCSLNCCEGMFSTNQPQKGVKKTVQLFVDQKSQSKHANKRIF